jgi:hypothetical protein
MTMRPELARRQREKAEALAAGDPRLDFSLASVGVLAGRNETDDVLAYVGEVLLREVANGAWDRLDGVPAITVATRTFDLRGLTDPDALRRVAAAVAEPSTAVPARPTWLTAAPLVVLYAMTMVALIWWFAGGRAALVAAAFGIGFAVMKRLRQPRAR